MVTDQTVVGVGVAQQSAAHPLMDAVAGGGATDAGRTGRALAGVEVAYYLRVETYIHERRRGRRRHRGFAVQTVGAHGAGCRAPRAAGATSSVER